MKKHAIIPIFIPHKGCPHDCVFCNQRAITARTADVTPEDVRRIAEQYLSTLEGRGLMRQRYPSSEEALPGSLWRSRALFLP